MSDTNIFRCKDEMPASTEGVVRTHMTATESASYAAPLPGQRKFPNDVLSVRAGMLNPTGRRP